MNSRNKKRTMLYNVKSNKRLKIEQDLNFTESKLQGISYFIIRMIVSFSKVLLHCFAWRHLYINYILSKRTHSCYKGGQQIGARKNSPRHCCPQSRRRDGGSGRDYIGGWRRGNDRSIKPPHWGRIDLRKVARMTRG